MVHLELGSDDEEQAAEERPTQDEAQNTLGVVDADALDGDTDGADDDDNPKKVTHEGPKYYVPPTEEQLR